MISETLNDGGTALESFRRQKLRYEVMSVQKSVGLPVEAGVVHCPIRLIRHSFIDDAELYAERACTGHGVIQTKF